MKLGLIQYDPKWEDKEENKSKLNSLIKRTVLILVSRQAQERFVALPLRDA